MKEKIEKTTSVYSSPEDIFKQFHGRSELFLHEAINAIGKTWDSMDPQERKSVFTNISDEISRQSWGKIILRQPVYEPVLMKVFGDHSPPYGSENMLDHAKIKDDPEWKVPFLEKIRNFFRNILA